MQFDVSKRNAMKMLSGVVGAAGASLFVPRLASASIQIHSYQPADPSSELSQGAITLTLEKDNSAQSGYVFVVKNESEESQSVRHMYPGIVSTPYNSFNFNESLPSDGVNLLPGQVLKLAAKRADSLIPEHALAPLRTNLQSVTVVTDTSVNGAQLPVSTVRTMFS